MLLKDMRQRETLLAYPSNLIVINDEHSVLSNFGRENWSRENLLEAALQCKEPVLQLSFRLN